MKSHYFEEIDLCFTKQIKRKVKSSDLSFIINIVADLYEEKYAKLDQDALKGDKHGNNN
jgi:hypothetical protein